MRASIPLFLALASCAPATPKNGSVVPASGQQLDALLARDLEQLPENRTVVGPAGLFVAKVPASLEPAVKAVAGAAQVAWSIGTEEVVQCILFGQRMNVADLLSTTITEVHSRFPAAELERVDAGEMNGEPFLAVDVLYHVDRGEERGVGELKVIALSHHAVTVVCTHDEPGYRRAFRDTVNRFAKTLVIMTDSDRLPPIFRALHVIQLGDRKVGFLDTWVEKQQGDEVTQSSSLALLSPHSDGRLSALDVDTYEVSDETNRLLEARYVSVEDHAERANLELNQRDSRTYTIRGSRDGKPVEVELIPPEGLLGDYGQERLAAAKLAEGAESWSAPTFDALHPSEVLTTTFARSGTDAHGTALVAVTEGDRRFQIAFDAHGHPLALAMSATDGETPLSFLRIMAFGEPEAK